MNEVRTEKTNSLKVWLPLIFGALVALGMFLGFQLERSAHQSENQPAVDLGNTGDMGKIEEILRYVESKYVGEVNREELMNAAIDGMLEHLDPHTNFIPADQLQSVNEQLEGNFDGIGVEFDIVEDTILIVSPLAGGPSEKVGIQAGDRIVYAGDSLVAGVKITTDKIVKLLRGKKGTEVEVKIKRKGQKDLLSFIIKRDEIPITSVDAGYMLEKEVGYIKVNRFSATTYTEFMQKMERLYEKEGMKNLVLDLRQNPGGYLQQATKMLSQLFQEKGQLMVYTEGRAYSRNNYNTSGRNFYDLENIVVLIDEGSASASEIMAGAIQDWDRGTLVGRRTFGKGLVQEQYNLSDGGALRLTVARYYTPSGRCIQKPYGEDMDYQQDLKDRFNSGELEHQDSINTKDTTQYYTLGEGRVVYGGGGVTPDVFVPIDKISQSDLFTRTRPFIPQFVIDQLDREEISTFREKELNQFTKNFSVSDDMLQDFLSFAELKGAEIEKNAVDSAAALIQFHLKAHLARQLYGMDGYYKVMNEDDPMIIESMKVISQ